MAAEIKRQTIDLMRLMQEDPAKFSLGQILRLIALEKKQHPAAPSTRIRSWLSLAFPATEVESVTEAQGVRRITATKGGLYSTLGPLPTFYTEELMEEDRNDSSVARDFLDIITDRLVKLDVRASERARLPQRCIEQQDTAAQGILDALSGSTDIPALQLMHTAAVRLLIGTKRTATGLACYLQLCADLPRVSIEQCVMSTVFIRPEQRCQLGQQGSLLGEDTVIGSYIPDINKKIRIHIYELTAEAIRSCLTGGETWKKICAATYEYLMGPLEFDIVLHPGPAAAQPQQLGINASIGAYMPSAKDLQPVFIYTHERHAA